MRYRPMPSAPRSTQWVDLVRKLDVAVQADPHAVGRLGRQIAEGFEPRRSVAMLLDLVPVAGDRLFVGLEDHQALIAVDDHQVAARTRRLRNGPVPTTAGISRASATMAVWLPGPPISVAKPATNSGLRLAVSLGVRLWASTMTGEIDLGQLFAAATEQVAQQAFLDVEDVVGTLREEAACRASGRL